MGAPYRSQNRDPLWLELNPAWKQELKDFGAATGIDVLAALMINGTRHRVGKDTLVSKGLMRPWHETFLENEPRDEEGFASENQVCRPVMEMVVFIADLSTHFAYVYIYSISVASRRTSGIHCQMFSISWSRHVSSVKVS